MRGQTSREKEGLDDAISPGPSLPNAPSAVLTF